MTPGNEPPGGDYAAYLNKRVNGAEGAPGAVGKAPAKRPRGQQASTPVKMVRHDHNSHTEFEYVPVDKPDAAQGALGPQGSARVSGVVQMFLGLGALLLFANMAMKMTYSDEPFALGYIVPLLLLGFIARMFLVRGRRRLRESRVQRGATQPAPPTARGRKKS